jgi:hypothetical protein
MVERLDTEALSSDAEAVERIAQSRGIEPRSALHIFLLICHEDYFFSICS